MQLHMPMSIYYRPAYRGDKTDWHFELLYSMPEGRYLRSATCGPASCFPLSSRTDECRRPKMAEIPLNPFSHAKSL